MGKKLSLLAAAIAVLALAVPAFASAGTGVVEGGVLVASGQTIVGTNVGQVTTTSTKTGNISCKSMIVDAVLTENTATEVKATSGSGTAKTCEVGANPTVTVHFILLSELKTTGGGTGTAALSYEVVLPSGTECHYSTSVATFIYKPGETAEGANTLKISEQALTVSP